MVDKSRGSAVATAILNRQTALGTGMRNYYLRSHYSLVEMSSWIQTIIMVFDPNSSELESY